MTPHARREQPGSPAPVVVVTHESHDPNRKNLVKIPNACEQFNVEWADTFWMLRELEVKFNWAVPS